jgi:hypothetical protein
VKVFHVVFSDPIGPSWIAYLNPPDITPNPKQLHIKSWVEETELNAFVKGFVDHVIMQREMGGAEGQNCMLEIRTGK